MICAVLYVRYKFIFMIMIIWFGPSSFLCHCLRYANTAYVDLDFGWYVRPHNVNEYYEFRDSIWLLFFRLVWHVHASFAGWMGFWSIWCRHWSALSPQSTLHKAKRGTPTGAKVNDFKQSSIELQLEMASTSGQLNFDGINENEWNL